ncbi:MAG: hypothetical protein IKP40_11305, partial [Clostridia bacterium]|nr:hypothetical protein [Clostridia bacterium]
VPMSASLWYTPSVPSLIPPVIFGAATLSITVSVPGWNFLRHFILQLAIFLRTDSDVKRPLS